MKSWWFVCVLQFAALMEVLGRSFRDMSYGAIMDGFQQLNSGYPGLFDLFTAQDRYNLTSPGSCRDVRGQPTPCVHMVVRITNEATLAPDRPEVFFSGALHGDERVGPNTLMELAILLTSAYGRDPYLTHLVNTRSIYMMPTTNALGYNNNQRTELTVDPNRDFGYDQSPTECMQTITARAVNELWREHIFQLAVTFHGGTKSISYEWGSWNHVKHNTQQSTESPDDAAQREIVNLMSIYAGTFDGQYPVGPLTDVYPVKGGMEDWGYAASWENSVSPQKQPVVECRPHSFNGYPAEKTHYDSVSIRAFNFLVEASLLKGPPANKYGTDEDILTPGGKGDGHVPQNIRLSLVVIDLVQPYINITSRLPSYALPGDVITVEWEVGGCLKVNDTQVIYTYTVDGVVGVESRSDPLSGDCKWGHAKSFVYSFFVEHASNLSITVRASVDQGWRKQLNPDPAVPPQSHMVNARTTSNYSMSSANRHIVRGQKQWMTVPHVVAIGAGNKYSISASAVLAPMVPPSTLDGTASKLAPLGSMDGLIQIDSITAGTADLQMTLNRVPTGTYQLFLHESGDLPFAIFGHDIFLGPLFNATRFAVTNGPTALLGSVTVGAGRYITSLKNVSLSLSGKLSAVGRFISLVLPVDNGSSASKGIVLAYGIVAVQHPSHESNWPSDDEAEATCGFVSVQPSGHLELTGSLIVKHIDNDLRDIHLTVCGLPRGNYNVKVSTLSTQGSISTGSELLFSVPLPFGHINTHITLAKTTLSPNALLQLRLGAQIQLSRIEEDGVIVKSCTLGRRGSSVDAVAVCNSDTLNDPTRTNSSSWDLVWIVSGSILASCILIATVLTVYRSWKRKRQMSNYQRVDIVTMEMDDLQGLSVDT